MLTIDQILERKKKGGKNMRIQNRTYEVELGHIKRLDFVKKSKRGEKNKTVNKALEEYWENHPELLEGFETEVE